MNSELMNILIPVGATVLTGIVLFLALYFAGYRWDGPFVSREPYTPPARIHPRIYKMTGTKKAPNGMQATGIPIIIIVTVIIVVLIALFVLFRALAIRSAEEVGFAKQFSIYASVLAAGFILSLLLYHFFRMRTPGVIATPLLAVYSLENIIALPVIIIVSAVIYVFIYFFYTRFFIYGRRLFLIGGALSILFTTPPLIYFGLIDVIIMTILPGIFAYNAIITVRDRGLSILLFLAELVVLLFLGFILAKIF